MKERLDKVIIKNKLACSREIAQELILQGKVTVNGIVSKKTSTLVKPNDKISIIEEPKYVSRGGYKLMGAIDKFKISLTGKAALDVGASTGGFTDCLLQKGIQTVYCVDVGYGQLAWKIREDKRVKVLDRTNARYLTNEMLPELVDIAVIDVSFISLKLIVPTIIKLLHNKGEILSLVKPQFEVGKIFVSKGGIVKEESKRIEALQDICSFYEGIGLEIIGTMESPIKGTKGNVEYFIYSKRT
ncbi:MAG TPA: TlyA family RNA methyltransferase [Nitrospirae bacterium]|nr:TlyA family RNA methyltransferase [Nitrospirota bacterium]